MTDIEKRFQKFHSENPRVFEFFDRFAKQLIARGHKHFSSDAILHRIRWETAVSTSGDAGFKINDHFSAHYARMWMEQNPSHDGFFRTRGIGRTVGFLEAA